MMEDSRSVFQHLFQRRYTLQGFYHSVLLHSAQVAASEADLADLLHCALLQYGIANIYVRDQQFIHADAAPVACEVARRAAFSKIERERTQFLGAEAKAAQHARLRHISDAAVGAHSAD